MNRLVAKVLLILMAVGLLFSIYAFFQGHIAEGMYLYPLLIVIYVFLRIGSKKEK